LRPGQIVVLDNLSVQKADHIQEAIEARGCTLLSLPPNSPDFTSIEQAFSKIKALRYGLGAHTREALLEAVGQAVTTITSEESIVWFGNDGYALSD
jgi:transposase